MFIFCVNLQYLAAVFPQNSWFKYGGFLIYLRFTGLIAFEVSQAFVIIVAPLKQSADIFTIVLITQYEFSVTTEVVQFHAKREIIV